MKYELCAFKNASEVHFILLHQAEKRGREIKILENIELKLFK